MPKINKTAAIIRDAAVITLVTLLLAEASLRIMGHEAFHFPAFSIVAEPATTLVPHPRLGLALRPGGTYAVTMNGGHHYQATHLPDSTRTTDTPDSLGGRGVHFYGCSFTYGMGVNDHETFTHLLQQALPSARVKNMGVPGHGTVQNLLALRQQLRNGTPPSHVFLGYAAFHDERNVLSPNYREHLHYGFRRMSPAVSEEFGGGSGAVFPYGEMRDGNLVMREVDMARLFRPVPLREYSAFANLCQSALNRHHQKKLDAQVVTLALVLKMQALCAGRGIPFTVASVTADEATENALRRFEEQGVKVLRMGVDTRLPQYNHQPYDSHPNAAAHRIYADRLLRYLSGDLPRGE